MSISIIVSYDGTPNDDDALAMARALRPTGAALALAYVRHSQEFDARREELAQHDAQRRLDQGASWLGDPQIARHVVVSASTGEGLAQLAESERAAMIVFGSDYRTPPGRVEPGTSAQYLLEGGPVAIAVAPAGVRATPDLAIKSIAVSDPQVGGAAATTAQALADKLGAQIVEIDGPVADLIVVGSQPVGQPGRIALSGATRSQLSEARSPVLVVPHERPVRF
jgi:nucleotide-binding universal stress UspA family protein